jgi:hypothetical protein
MNIHVFHGIAVATAIFAGAHNAQADAKIAGDVFSDAAFWYSGATDVGNDLGMSNPKPLIASYSKLR